MFFREHFIAICDCLDARFRALRELRSNPADKGELCELFVKEFLQAVLADNFRIVRGGNVVCVDGARSSQLDVILLSKNTLTLFAEKGLYPIESVLGAFSVTATLNWRKLETCIAEFASLPKEHPRFDFIQATVDRAATLDKWRERVPFKCVFAYAGEPAPEWCAQLNTLAASSPETKATLPDLVVVNKKAMIRKLHQRPQPLIGGGLADADFLYADLTTTGNYGAPITTMLNELFILSTWRFSVIPDYPAYFNKELD